MGFRKKKVTYDYVITSQFISGLMSCVQSYVNNFSEDDDVITQVKFSSTFSLRGKCRIFELVGAGNNIKAMDLCREKILGALKEMDVIYDLASRLYEDACSSDSDVIEVAAAFTNSCPVSKKPGLILYWKR